MFMDPRTGEVLACVNVPHLPPGKGAQLELHRPIRARIDLQDRRRGASLEEGTARPDQWFEAAASGEAVMVPARSSTTRTSRRAARFRDAVALVEQHHPWASSV